MKKGGYQIIDLKGLDITAGGTVEGIYEAIEGNYRKPLLLSGIIVNGVEKADVFVMAEVSEDDFVIKGVYGYELTITDEDVVSGSNKVKIFEITDANGDTITKETADAYVRASKDGFIYFRGYSFVEVNYYDPTETGEDGEYLTLQGIRLSENGEIDGTVKCIYTVTASGDLKLEIQDNW